MELAIAEQWNVMGNYAWQHATNQQTNQQVTGVPEHHVYFALDGSLCRNGNYSLRLIGLAVG